MPSNRLDNLSFIEIHSADQLEQLLKPKQKITNALGYEAYPTEITIAIVLVIILFCNGVIGNAFVLHRIIVMQRELRSLYGRGAWAGMVVQRYLLLLTIVDLLVTILIPMLVPFMFYGQWLLGEFCCKLYMTIESVNKLLSVHILTALAIERYCVVRQSVSHSGCLNARVVSSLYLLITSFFVFSLLPVLKRVQVEIITMPELGQNITTCISPMPDDLVELFVVYSFLQSYCVPAAVIAFCYIALIRILKQRYVNTPISENTKAYLIQKVTNSIMSVSLFHFVCWTPFWICLFLPHFPLTKPIADNIPSFGILQMFSVICPYINCSCNWVFYVLLNQRLRRQLFRRSSSHTTCDRMLNRN